MKLNIVHSTELDGWIRERHYLHSTPAGAVIRMEFLDDNGNRIGAMMWGRNTSPKADYSDQPCLRPKWIGRSTPKPLKNTDLKGYGDNHEQENYYL